MATSEYIAPQTNLKCTVEGQNARWGFMGSSGGRTLIEAWRNGAVNCLAQEIDPIYQTLSTSKPNPWTTLGTCDTHVGQF